MKEKRQRTKQIFGERASKAEEATSANAVGQGCSGMAGSREEARVAAAGSEGSMAQVKSGAAGEGRRRRALEAL